jgi:hypothetical protein
MQGDGCLACAGFALEQKYMPTGKTARQDIVETSNAGCCF